MLHHARLLVIGFFNQKTIVLDDFDRLFLSGSPGARSWYANISANGEVTLHVKRGATADIPMRGRPITEETERRELIPHILPEGRNLDEWVAGSPLVPGAGGVF